MALSINQNIMAMNSYRNLSATQGGLAKSLEKLSSGFRVNRAADDAAGLGISEGLRSQVRGNGQAVRNAQDGISLVQTAEGALNEVHDMLQRMRVLAVQGANGTNSDKNKGSINEELTALSEEIGRISKVTDFNGLKMLDGTTKEVVFQVGANATEDDTIKVAGQDISKYKDDLDEKITAAKDNATYQALITALDEKITDASTKRGSFGAVQNRFEHTINNLNVAVENLAASESRIRDTDMAAEMMQFTRGQILSQAGTAMLAQANQVPQGVLSLLR
ncbi:flagellin [uncultured Mobiluncus sp.]|uniref:flagellin N-terminal helical domain-containing protein n=1 Tax=uncultured Mobiluncus sp. TaxID=293425 RepID=UPI002609BE3E|nr:flagellin [uncultured Mobiluncus sp.]